MPLAQYSAVATLVEPGERPRLDAVAAGRFTAYHAADLGEAAKVVRERRVSALLVSPRCVRLDQLEGMAALVEGFPGVSTVAVLSRPDPDAGERLLALGACGVRWAVDLSARDGWRRLRELVAEPTTPAASRILASVIPALGEPTRSCRRFFELLIRLAPVTTSVRSFVRRVGVRPSTFMSRFFRAQLPSPKRYLVAVRLVYAAGLLEAAARSISDVAYQLEYSSPQSFGRHVRTALGMTASEFRRRHTLATALNDLVARLIVPYQARLHTFHPLDHGARDLGQER